METVKESTEVEKDVPSSEENEEIENVVIIGDKQIILQGNINSPEQSSVSVDVQRLLNSENLDISKQLYDFLNQDGAAANLQTSDKVIFLNLSGHDYALDPSTEENEQGIEEINPFLNKTPTGGLDLTDDIDAAYMLEKYENDESMSVELGDDLMPSEESTYKEESLVITVSDDLQNFRTYQLSEKQNDVLNFDNEGKLDKKKEEEAVEETMLLKESNNLIEVKEQLTEENSNVCKFQSMSDTTQSTSHKLDSDETLSANSKYSQEKDNENLVKDVERSPEVLEKKKSLPKKDELTCSLERDPKIKGEESTLPNSNKNLSKSGNAQSTPTEGLEKNEKLSINSTCLQEKKNEIDKEVLEKQNSLPENDELRSFSDDDTKIEKIIVTYYSQEKDNEEEQELLDKQNSLPDKDEQSSALERDTKIEEEASTSPNSNVCKFPFKSDDTVLMSLQGPGTKEKLSVNSKSCEEKMNENVTQNNERKEEVLIQQNSLPEKDEQIFPESNTKIVIEEETSTSTISSVCKSDEIQVITSLGLEIEEKLPQKDELRDFPEEDTKIDEEESTSSQSVQQITKDVTIESLVDKQNLALDPPKSMLEDKLRFSEEQSEVESESIIKPDKLAAPLAEPSLDKNLTLDKIKSNSEKNELTISQEEKPTNTTKNLYKCVKTDYMSENDQLKSIDNQKKEVLTSKESLNSIEKSEFLLSSNKQEKDDLLIIERNDSIEKIKENLTLSKSKSVSLENISTTSSDEQQIDKIPSNQEECQKNENLTIFPRKSVEENQSTIPEEQDMNELTILKNPEKKVKATIIVKDLGESLFSNTPADDSLLLMECEEVEENCITEEQEVKKKVR